MKNSLKYLLLLSVVFVLLFSTSCQPVEIQSPESDSEVNQSQADKPETSSPSQSELVVNGNIIILNELFPLSYDRPENPDPEKLSIIKYVLAHFVEDNIHKMRGETDNVVYITEDGREAVYDKNGDLVTNSYNAGSYNFYFAEEEPIKKFLYDTMPWLAMGNNNEDPTSIDERLYYYTLDLDYGIQDYIFYGVDEKLEEISFNQLTDDEKEVYYLFLYLLFNNDYEIQLKSENIERLRDDGEYYYNYFYQIQESLNLE